MKTKLLCMSLFMLVAINLAAQNTSLEENLTRMGKDTTQMERFLKECKFYTFERFAKIDEDLGLNAEAYVYKDLISKRKIGVLQFWENHGREHEIYFGTLDGDEIDDLILALKNIVEEANTKHYGKSCRIYYETRSGISVLCKINTGEVYFGKTWYYTNIYGTRCSYAVSSSKGISMKKFAKIIDWLTKSKEYIQKELENPD